MTGATTSVARDGGTAGPSRRAVAGLAAVVAVALLAAPWVVDAYTISMLSRILVFGLLAMSVNVLTGITGMPTLGQAAYFGVGAYTAAIIGRTVTDVGPLQVVAAIATGAAAAAVTGLVAIRARGVAFLMITLAIGEIAHSAAVSWDSLTHGSDGMPGVPHVVAWWGTNPLELDGLVYYYVLGVFVLLAAIVVVVVRSPFGLTLRGIRDNEDRMRAIGYPVGQYLLAGYVFAGAIAGGAGALWVSLHRFVSPGDLGFEISALALLAVVIGGAGSMWGACVGAAVVVVTRDYVGSDVFEGRSTLLLGILFVVAVYLLPKGVGGIRLPRGRKAVTR